MYNYFFRKIYWTDWGSNISRIESSDLDGENRKVIHDKNLKYPNGITIDYQKRRLYWVNSNGPGIEMCELSTGKVSQLYKEPRSTHPFGISLLGDYIYWTDWHRKVFEYQQSTGSVKVVSF